MMPWLVVLVVNLAAIAGAVYLGVSNHPWLALVVLVGGCRWHYPEEQRDCACRGVELVVDPRALAAEARAAQYGATTRAN